MSDVSISPITPGAVPRPVTPPSKPQASEGAGFGDLVTKGLEQVEKLQSQADQMSVQAATGDLTDVHDFMIASTKATLATELTVAVRNKAIEAFNEIMRMQI